MINQLKKIWYTHKVKFTIATAVIFLITGLINFYFIYVVTAQSNDECLWVPKKVAPDSLAIYFDQVKVGGVAWQAGIRDGDILVAIDGVKAKDLIVATRVLDKVTKGDYATYTVMRNGTIFETPVLVKKLINFSGLAFSLLSFIWVIVGSVVVLAKPHGRVQNIFFRVGLVAVLFSTSNLLYRGAIAHNPIFENIVLVLLIDFLQGLGGIFLPFVVIHFFSVFPKEFNFTSQKWFRYSLYSVPVIFLIAVNILRWLFVYRRGSDILYGIITNTISILVIVGFVIGLILLFINYLRIKSKQERNPIFIILIAYFVGVVAIIYTVTLAPSIAGLIFNNPEYFMPVLLIALLPVAFGYSIFKYSLMDVSDVIKNTIFYGAATVLLAGFYFLIIYVIGQSVSTAIGTEYQGFIAGIIFVVFAVVFQSTKDRFQDLLTAKFYPEQFTFRNKLLKFSSEIASTVGYDNILDSMVKLFVNSLKLQHFGLMLVDNKPEKVYQLVRQEGFSNPDIKIFDENNSIERFFLEQIVIGKKGFLERQDFGSSVEHRFIILLEENIYTVVPLIIKSKVIGLLLFGLKYSGSQFSGKDIDLLLNAASQTAMSLENARLYESETEKRKLERDLENARKIQESLLPKVYPSIENLEMFGAMIPAMLVGGDYYDLIKISDSRLFVVIGDVSGKGLSASFYMSKLQTMIRMYCSEGRTPKDILVEINKRISVEIEKNWFITVTIGLVDTEKGTITFSRAGHTPLLKCSPNSFEIYQPGGIGVGLDNGEVFDSSLEEIEVDIKPDELIFIFSDGVNELMNDSNELFGIERIKEFLKQNINRNAVEIGNSLLGELNRFKGRANQYDDITFVVMKYTK